MLGGAIFAIALLLLFDLSLWGFVIAGVVIALYEIAYCVLVTSPGGRGGVAVTGAGEAWAPVVDDGRADQQVLHRLVPTADRAPEQPDREQRAHSVARTNARHSGRPASREDTTRKPSTPLPHVRPCSPTRS